MPDALHLKIHGIDCAEEVGILKRELRDLVGNESDLSFDILNGCMTVQDRGRLSVPQVIERAMLRFGPPSPRTWESRSW